MGQALGFVETRGLVTCIQAADTIMKAADVELVGFENMGSTLVKVIVKGDVGAVKAAIEAGVIEAKKIGSVTASLVIPSPDKDLDPLLQQYSM